MSAQRIPRFTRVAVAFSLACTAAAHAAPPHVTPAPHATSKPVAASVPALTRADMDTTCPPCRDFNRYANGGWIDRATIPAAYPVWGSFTALADKNQSVLRGIL